MTKYVHILLHFFYIFEWIAYCVGDFKNEYIFDNAKKKYIYPNLSNAFKLKSKALKHFFTV